MIRLINSLFRFHLKQYQAEINDHYEIPLQLQEDTRRALLAKAQDTVFAKTHRLHPSDSATAFAEKVPIRTYDELMPYLERTLNGEEGVLTHEKIRWIAKTSGTTSGKSKYIPLSKSNIYECHVKGSWMTLAALYNQREDLQIFARKNLLVGGGVYGTYGQTEATVADISGVMVQHIPLVARPFYIPDIHTATLPNYEEKIAKIAPLGAAESSMTMLGGVPTWNLSLYRQILKIRQADNLLQVWPNLQAYIHGGVSFDPYREHFRQLIPSDDFIYHEVYNASEGFFALQDRRFADDLLLLLNNGVYYEFIPFETYRKGERIAIPLSQVQTNEPYVMIITTNTGLFRYLLGDLVTFTSDNPYRIKIVGRTQEYINAFGEDLLLDNVERALVRACQDHQCGIENYSIAPRYIEIGQKGCHQWFVEFASSPKDIDAFAHDLDLYLQHENKNYAQKRSNNFAISNLEIIHLPSGFFTTWLRKKGKVGGQSKVPRLANNRKFAEEILAMLA